MQPEPVAMIIADISGYTRFMLQHAKALRHSQMVVSGLLQAITDQAVGLLKVSKLEGDAAFMYLQKDLAGSQEAVRQEMLAAAADLEFEKAAELRDKLLELEKEELTLRGG